MKIAQVIPSLLPTGPVHVALEITCLLRTAGHEVAVFYFDKLPGALPFAGARQIGFRDAALLKSYEVVHTHGLRPDLFGGWHANRLPPVVSTLHNYVKDDLAFRYPAYRWKPALKLWNRAAARHRAAIVLSPHMHKYYLEFWRCPRLEVIPNTRQRPETLPDFDRLGLEQFAERRLILGAVSAVHERKGLRQIIDLLTLRREWVYVHVGDGELAELCRYAEQQGVADRCHFVGGQDSAWPFYQVFDLLVLPSYSEGFPLVLLEAIQMGVPVLSSDIPAVASLFPREAVERFPLQDIPAMAAAADRVLQEGDARRASSRQIFEEQYSAEVVLDKTVNLYQSL